jgi:AmmeMemoRadiSam system protein B
LLIFNKKGENTMKTRPADFAGSWYPGNAAACEKQIQSFLKEKPQKAFKGSNILGGIVPHAGWFFSGSIACTVINSLKDEAPPDVFLMYGMHLHQNSSAFIMTEGSWDTPFGPIEIHEMLAKKMAAKFTFTIETAGRYNRDNTIELQLPFIKYFFPESKILPMGIPPTHQSIEIGKAVVLSAQQMGLNVKIVGSTDLTHYGPNYGFMPKGSGETALKWVKTVNDKQMIDAMLALNSEHVMDKALNNQSACCSGAASAAIASAKQLGSTQTEMLSYATSYDISPGSSFVGYVGIVFKRSEQHRFY